MVLTSWLNIFRLAPRKPVRNSLFGQFDQNSVMQNSRLETLEERALLSAVSFDALNGQLSFLAENDTDDDVLVTSLGPTTLQITVGNGDAISLFDDAFNNSGFVLSTTNTPDDTLTIDTSLMNSNVLSFDFDLSDGTNELTAGGLTVGGLTVINGGSVTLDQVIVGPGGLDVSAQVIQIDGSVAAMDALAGDIVLMTSVGGSVVIDTASDGMGVTSAAGGIFITADVLVISELSPLTALQAVEIETADSERFILLGSTEDDTEGVLELSDDELNMITADVLRIGSLDLTANIFVIDVISLDPLKVDTLAILTNGGLANTPDGTLSVTNLRVHGNEGIFLDQNLDGYPDVAQVALRSDNGPISFLSENDLTIGTVDGLVGVAGSDDGVAVGSYTGTLTVTDTLATHDVTSGNGGVLLAGFGPGGVVIQSGADVYGLDGIQLIGNQLHINGTLTALGAEVFLTPAGDLEEEDTLQSMTPIDLGGADSATHLGISDAELDRITADTIEIGDTGDYSLPDIEVTGTASPAHAANLLLSGNMITQQGGLVVANRLALRTYRGAGSIVPLSTQVSELAFFNLASGNVGIDNAGPLALTGVLDLTQSANLAGDVTITTHSPLTIATTMLAGGDIYFTAAESIDAGDNLTINSGVTVTSTGGSIDVRAGDRLTQSGTLTVQVTAATITLTGGDNDADGFGAVTLSGALTTFDSSPQIWGGSGSDTITINQANGLVIGGGEVGVYIDGGLGNDHYALNFNAGEFTRTIVIDDASGVLDTLTINATETDDTVTYDTTLSTPRITLGSHRVDFVGLETAAIDGRDAAQDSLEIVENVPGFAPPGDGTVDTTLPLTYSNFENLSITNSVPTVSNLSVTDSDEAGTATLTGEFSDPELNFDQTFTLQIDWGDGTPVQDVTIVYTSATQSFAVTHSYADDNPSGTVADLKSVSVVVIDDNGGASAEATTTALVENVNPSIQVITFSTAANEGGVALLEGTYADVGLSDSHVLTIDWDDGTPLQTVVVTGGTFSVTHVYADDTPTGTGLDLRHPTLTIEDDDGGTASSQPQILVHNLAPQIDSLNVTSAVDEGGVVTLTGTYSDPGLVDTHQLSIDWDDGSSAEVVSISAGAFSVTHLYQNQPNSGSANAQASIIVTLLDDDGGQDTGAVDTTVSNLDPVITAINIDSEIDENDEAILTGTYTDAGINDTHTLDIDWGDGSPIQTVTVTGGTFSVPHRYLDDTPTDTAMDHLTVSVTLRDGDTGSDTASVELDIFDKPPVLSNVQISQSSIDEGGSVTITGDYSDVGTLDTHEIRINWNDGSPIEFVQVSGGHFSVTHQFLDDRPTGTPSDTISIQIALTDDDRMARTDNVLLTVNNIAPTATINGAPVNSIEGTVFNLTSTVTDVGTQDTITYAWTVTKNGNPFATGAAADFSFTPNDSGTYVVSLTVTDDDSGAVSATQQTITVAGQAPTLQITGPTTVVYGQIASFTLQANDPGGLDQAGQFTYLIDWDNDGTNDQTVIGPNLVPILHEYEQLGSKTIRVTVTDKDGQTSAPQTLIVNVVQASLQAGILYVGGTSAGDRIRIEAALNNEVEVVLNGTSLGVFAPTVGIQVFGSDGNDNIRVDKSIILPCDLYGQDGKDTLWGGSGNDLLDGGAGRDELRGRDGNDILLGGDDNDFLSAGRGADILIGGLGKDQLYGFNGDELLIGGTTSHDGDNTELNALRNEWTSPGTFDVRVANLTNGGGANGNVTVKPGVDATDDNVQDTLYGERGLNWFITFLTDTVLGKNNRRNRIG